MPNQTAKGSPPINSHHVKTGNFMRETTWMDDFERRTGFIFKYTKKPMREKFPHRLSINKACLSDDWSLTYHPQGYGKP